MGILLRYAFLISFVLAAPLTFGATILSPGQTVTVKNASGDTIVYFTTQGNGVYASYAGSSYTADWIISSILTWNDHLIGEMFYHNGEITSGDAPQHRKLENTLDDLNRRLTGALEAFRTEMFSPQYQVPPEPPKRYSGPPFEEKHLARNQEGNSFDCRRMFRNR